MDWCLSEMCCLPLWGSSLELVSPLPVATVKEAKPLLQDRSLGESKHNFQLHPTSSITIIV